MLIPLHARAHDDASRRPVLGDRRARELVDAIDYDFTRFGGTWLSGSAFRSSIFDGWAARFLREHPAATVVELDTGFASPPPYLFLSEAVLIYLSGDKAIASCTAGDSRSLAAPKTHGAERVFGHGRSGTSVPRRREHHPLLLTPIGVDVGRLLSFRSPAGAPQTKPV